MADSSTISAEKLCSLTGLTDRRHRQLAKEGYFPSPIKSQYQLAATISGAFRYYRELSQRQTRTLSDDKSLKTRREIELLELKIRQQRREAIPLSVVLQVWEAQCIAMRQEINAMELTEDQKKSLSAHLRDADPREYIRDAADGSEEVPE